MTWNGIIDLLKRLDAGLSDAVYLRGRYLTGEEKTQSHEGERGADKVSRLDCRGGAQRGLRRSSVRGQKARLAG